MGRTNEPARTSGRSRPGAGPGRGAQTMAHGMAEASLFDRRNPRPAVGGRLPETRPPGADQNPVMFVVLIGTIVTFIES